MSHDSHGHEQEHHDHASEHVYFDEGGVSAVGWLYAVAAIGIIFYLVLFG